MRDGSYTIKLAYKVGERHHPRQSPSSPESGRRRCALLRRCHAFPHCRRAPAPGRIHCLRPHWPRRRQVTRLQSRALTSYEWLLLDLALLTIGAPPLIYESDSASHRAHPHRRPRDPRLHGHPASRAQALAPRSPPSTPSDQGAILRSRATTDVTINDVEKRQPCPPDIATIIYVRHQPQGGSHHAATSQTSEGAPGCSAMSFPLSDSGSCSPVARPSCHARHPPVKALGFSPNIKNLPDIKAKPSSPRRAARPEIQRGLLRRAAASAGRMRSAKQARAYSLA